MNKKMFKIAKALTSITQVSLTMLFPTGIFIWLGRWLVKNIGFPSYVMPAAVVIGVVSGFYSMLKYLKTVTKED